MNLSTDTVWIILRKTLRKQHTTVQSLTDQHKLYRLQVFAIVNLGDLASRDYAGFGLPA